MRGRSLTPLYDIAVIGSGFAGSLTAMIAQRLGQSVILLERGMHPRVVIGESSTPLANLLLEELAVRYDLPRLKPLAKYGSWQQTYPEIACGLKRGFSFYHHDLSGSRSGEPDRDHQLLVAASPHNRIADTHWYRADVDHAFVNQAQALGVEYLDEVQLDRAIESSDRVSLKGKRHGNNISFDARFVVDATGPRGFLHRALGLREVEVPEFPRTQSLYSHFRGVERSDQGCADEVPPYPVDDAAVHHVFDGGWIWVLRFNNGVTSAGVAAMDKFGSSVNLSDGKAAWERLIQRIPKLRAQFADAQATMPFTYVPRLSFRSSEIAGRRWALLPSAAGFVDPLLSTGFPLTLLGVARIAEAIENHWCSPRFATSLDTYSSQTDGELLAAGRLIAALYTNMHDFAVFTSLSLLYFAAATFAETTRRLKKPHLAKSFLLYDDPVFGPACQHLLRRASGDHTRHETSQFARDVHQAIEPFNVAGLGDPRRRNWYPVEAEDLFRSAEKVQATRGDVAHLLSSSGFYE